MSDLHSRISEVVLHFGLTKTEFAKRINIAQSMVSEMCAGKKNPSDRTISDICREFNVSETWLREGKGEMLVPLSLDQSMAMAWGRMMAGRDDSAERRKAFVGALLEMPPEMLDSLYDALKIIVDRFDEP